jgi:hypothetical protein
MELPFIFCEAYHYRSDRLLLQSCAFRAGSIFEYTCRMIRAIGIGSPPPCFTDFDTNQLPTSRRGPYVLWDDMVLYRYGLYPPEGLTICLAGIKGPAAQPGGPVSKESPQRGHRLSVLKGGVLETEWV